MAKSSTYTPDTVLDDADLLLGFDAASGKTKNFPGSVIRAGMATSADLSAHTSNVSNPHSVTKAQVGLGSVPNTDATARANHTGTQSADTLTDGTTNKAFLATERTKLAGIATAATANDTDANLKNRANHTGSQLASTISDLQEAVEDIVGAQLTAGTNITLTYNDTTGKLTIDAAGGGGGGTTLAALTDATITSPANNDILTYETATSKWKNKTIATLGLALDSAVAKLTGNQTIAGIKTFTSQIIASAGVKGKTMGHYVVAANDAPQAWKDRADYQCDGVGDQVELNAAITQALADGTPIDCSPGNFALASTLLFAGTNNPDTGFHISLKGCGAYNTFFNPAANVDALKFYNTVKVNMADFGINVPTGSGSGLVSVASASANRRSFWLSSFKNIQVTGDWAGTSTGWAFKFGSPFRSTFDNLEAGGLKNGMQIASEYSDFNPGDCTFNRMFLEIIGVGGVAYNITSPSGKGVMNQMTFNMCEGIANSSGSTGLLLDGTGQGVSWNRFNGINLEQFDTIVNVQNGEGNDFNFNYIEATSGGTVFKTGTAGFNNRFQADYIYSASTQTLVNDGNTTDTAQPNRFHNSKVYADTGATMNITDVTGTYYNNNVKAGAAAGSVSSKWTPAAAAGDASTNTATSVDSEVALFSSTTGKILKRASITGLAKLASGVLSAATAGTDYYAPGSTDVAIADGGTGASTLPTGILKGAGTGAITAVTAPAGAVVGTTDTQTLTNKRITQRIGTTASSSTPTPDADANDQYNVTALAAGATFGAPTGTPTDGQPLIIRIKDNATARTLAWNAIYRAVGVTLPTTTVISKTLYLGMVYNAADTKWDVIATALEA